MKFKAGDKVVNIRAKSQMDVVRSVPGMPEYDECEFTAPDEGFILEMRGWRVASGWNLLRRNEWKGGKR